MDAASLFQLYEDTFRDLLDSLVPRHSVKSRSNLVSPWFDAECRSVKRNVRRLGRCYRQSRMATDRLAWVTAIREKHYFFKTKENEYWEHTITEQRSDSKKLWRTVSTVLGKPSSSFSTPPFSPSEFLSFLSSKVETIRSATSDSPPPVFTPTDCNLSSFDLCHPDDVSRIIKASLAKGCDLDPAPTFLINEYLDVMLPFLTRLCNASIQTGCLPTSQKIAMVTPRLKKSGLDPAATQNYRPISNLPFMSKVIEKLILAQLSRYLAANNLFPDYHSGFRRHHSTETAILRVLSDIYAAIDRDQVSLLALLDVSAAFDTVDHGILLERLSTSNVRALWDGFHLAGVLYHCTCAGHLCWWTPVYLRHGLFWCPSRFSPNSLLYGTSAYLLDRLQSVLNSSARLILKIRKYDPISTAVRRDLHWLPIQARIQFKLNVITRNCLVGQAPAYLT